MWSVSTLNCILSRHLRHRSPLYPHSLPWISWHDFYWVGCQPHAQPPTWRAIPPFFWPPETGRPSPQALDVHFGRLATLGLLLSSGHHTENSFPILMFKQKAWSIVWVLNTCFTVHVVTLSRRLTLLKCSQAISVVSSLETTDVSGTISVPW
jgi:hypothetical protein